MDNCALTDRQKDMLRALVPGFKDGTVDSEWHLLTGDGGIMDAFGSGELLHKSVWKDVTFADFAVFERCGFLQNSGTRKYVLFEQEIINAVEKNFGSLTKSEIAEPTDRFEVAPVFGSPLSPTSRSWPDVFVLMPFAEELRPVFSDHIHKIVHDMELRCERADDFFSDRQIMEEVWSAIFHAKVCVVDCTGRNPNVFYELGIAHTLGKPCIIIAQSEDDIPFDLRQWRRIIYQYTPPGMQDFENKLSRTLETVLSEVQVEPRRLTQPNDRQILTQDVLEAFGRIPDIKNEEVIHEVHRARSELIKRGVDTVSQLNELVTDDNLLNTLRDIYKELWKRQEPHILDPMAVAIYGALLYVWRSSPQMIEFIKQDIRQLPEYKRQNPDSGFG